jgi:hypothetical protein
MPKLIGNAPNQVPTNADLGSMAFEDRTNYITKGASVHQPFRNIIINGDMSIAQRATSTSSITSATYATVDRWRTVVTTLGTWTQSQDTDVPSGQGFAKSLKMDCTTADASPSALDKLYFLQRFEGQNLQYLKKGTSSAKSLTASFWVKSNKTGTYICELLDNDNSDRHINKSYTINSANTWEKKTITFAGDTTGTLDNDNNGSLFIQFWLGAGSTYTSGTLQTSWGASTNANRAVGQVNLADNTANEWYITGVQLEAGTTASDFEFLPVDVNLQRCQRYLEVFKKEGSETVICLAQGVSSAQVFGRLFFKTEKRAVPSGSVSAFGDFQVLLGNASSWSTATTGGLGSGDLKCIRLNLEGLSGMIIGGCHELRINGANGKVFCDAEL